jgi:hypothetical protein
MLKRAVIGCCLAIVLLAGTLVFRQLRNDSRTCFAESLLVVRPFNNGLLAPAFEREVMGNSPAIVRLGFCLAPLKETTLKGTTLRTNGLIRLVAAGPTAADAERSADSAAGAVGSLLERHYGIHSAPIGPAQSVSSSTLRKPFWPRLGNPTPGYFPTAGRVLFPLPGISIDPGEGWMRSYTVWPKAQCGLTLIGKGKFNGGFIIASVFSPEITNVQSAVESRRGEAEGQQGFIASSWKEEPFATESGLHGAHISYIRQYPAAFQGWTVLMTQTSHDYLVTNAQSRCVGITYDSAVSSHARSRATAPGGGHQEVQEVIRRTLRTE